MALCVGGAAARAQRLIGAQELLAEGGACLLAVAPHGLQRRAVHCRRIQQTEFAPCGRLASQRVYIAGIMQEDAAAQRHNAGLIQIGAGMLQRIGKVINALLEDGLCLRVSLHAGFKHRIGKR